MVAKPDVSTLPENPDTALTAARAAEKALTEAAELLYIADRVSGTVQSRAAIVALRSARTAVEHMTHCYQRIREGKQP